MSQIKAVIGYPGSKLRFYPYMKQYFPRDMKTMIEPFLGGASVSMSVSADKDFDKLERIIAGDLAPEVWALWTGVKTCPYDMMAEVERLFEKWCPTQKIAYEFHREVCAHTKALGDVDGYLKSLDMPESDKQILRDKLLIFEQSIKEGKAFWEWASKVDTKDMSIAERAARMFIVNRTSFSSTGDSGSMSNIKYSEFNYGLMSGIPAASELFKKIEVLNVPFQETMKFANDDPENTFVFLDPPYFKQEESGLYGRNGDTHKGFPHDEFARVTKELPCKWFVTYDDSVKVRRMFRGCNIKEFKIPTGYLMAMGTGSDDALCGEEVFIANYSLDNESYDTLNMLK